MSMRKKPSRPTPEEKAAEHAAFAELQERIRLLTDELDAAGSAYSRVGLDDQLAYAIGRIDAELASNR